MNNKQQRYSMQQQSYPRSYNPQGVPPQGAAGSAPRNSNALNMRAQNGPRQSQPQQTQVHNQQHSGMASGVPVSQHPHHQQQQHGTTGQQQAQQHPQMYAYAQHPHQFYYPQQYTFPMQAHQFVQLNPQARMISQVQVNPQQQQQQQYIFYPQQAANMYHQVQQNQPTMVQQHQPNAQQQNTYNHYSQAYIAQQTRLPMHSPAVHSAVQVPTVHATQGQHVQQTPQHGHHQHVSQPQSNSAQMGTRNESVPVATTERKRERKILNIVDPNTGARVIDEVTVPSTSTTAEPVQENGTPSTVEPKTDLQQPPTQVPVVAISQDLKIQEVSAQVSPASDEDSTVIKQEKLVKTASEDQGTDESKSKARAEFFQKITSSASDDGGNGRNTPGSNGQGGVANPPSPIPAAQAPEQPESPPIDSSKSQQAVVTPAANTSSDDSKDTSLVSVSPTPLECYLTPRKTSPPGQVEERSFEEENIDSQHEEEESLSTTVEIIQEEEEEVVVVVSPIPQEEEEEEQEEQLPESETSTVELVEVETESICPAETSITKEEDDQDEVLSVNDKSESASNEGPSEEQVSIVNHNGEVEEGEILNADDEDEVEIGADESGADDGEINESGDKDPKKKKKYDRDFLLNIGEQVKHSKIPVVLLADARDLAKDANSNNQMRAHNMSKSPGGPRDQQFNRMNRGGPGQGSKPMGGMMGMNYPSRVNQHGGGMMGWQPMMVPPRPPPPKVIELTREEVKLHKADDAWKPGVKQHNRHREEDQPKDSEESITDDLVKKTRGILNKLTPENFSKLVHKFMGLPLEDKEERISKVIKVVFEKAVDEPSFSKEYAKMVHTVCNASQETSRKFRKQILDQCQQEFQNNNSEEGKIKELEQKYESAEENIKVKLKAELDEMKFQMRRRSLGNVRFIGELYKLQMLTPKIMVECVGMLISSTDEESLECLCKLLTTVGQKLEEQLKEIELRVEAVKNYKNKEDPNAPKMPKFIPEDKWMTKIFNILRNLSDNKKLSSRIRFALLDVFELRDNYWKPRRDANAPKTIEEVRRDAYKQEMEEKRQISNLPPPSAMDQRSSSRTGPPQPKKGDWSVQNSSSKSSRFLIKKPDAQGSLPLLAPPTQQWGSRPGNSGPQQSKPPMPTAPRFMNSSNRFQELAEEKDRGNNRDRLNSNQQPPPSSLRDSMPPAQSPYAPNTFISTPTRRISPPISNASSRENSRPVSPKDTPPLSMINNECTADVPETVKNIFEEFCSGANTADTLDWIRQRFPAEKVAEFVDELSKQVGEMSKLSQQQKAGSLVRLLIKSNEINLSKNTVLLTLSQSVIADLPDIRIDVPMVSNYLAQFLVEIFHDDSNLDWLLTLEEGLQGSEEYESAWNEFCVQSLSVLRSKTNEDVVRTMYNSTKENSRVPLQELRWLCPDPESIANDMVPVLMKNLVVNNKDDILQTLKEHSWDLREDLIRISLIEAICIITWNPKLQVWDETILRKLLPLLPLPNPKLFPLLWKQICSFLKRKEIDNAQKDALWELFYMLDFATTEEPTGD